MKINTNKLKKFEERMEKVIEDPAKIIQIIMRILDMGCTIDSKGTHKVNPPVLAEQKVTFYEFVKYFGNYQIERDEEHSLSAEVIKEDMNLA